MQTGRGRDGSGSVAETKKAEGVTSPLGLVLTGMTPNVRSVR